MPIFTACYFPNMVGRLVKRGNDKSLIAQTYSRKSISDAGTFQNIAFYKQRPRMNHNVPGKICPYARDERS